MSAGAVTAVILLAVALAWWRPARPIRAALGPEHLLATGHAFLLLGVLVGLAIDAATEDVLARELPPLLSLVAGWVGFSVGMRLELRVLRPLPARLFLVAAAPAVAAAGAVGLPAWLLLRHAGASPPEAAAAAIVLGAAAANSAPSLVALVRRRLGRAAGPGLALAELSASLDDALVTAMALVAFAVFRVPGDEASPVALVALSVAAGALLGVSALLLLRLQASDQERLLLGLAILALAAGVAGWIHASPTAVAAVTAAVLVNTAPDGAAPLLSVVRRLERPVVVVLMVVVGLHAAATDGWLPLALLGLMTVARLGGKVAGGAAVAAVALPGGRPGRLWGLGLVPQGVLGPMIALTLFTIWRGDASRAVLGAVAFASVFNELLAPLLLPRSVAAPRRPR